LAVTWCHCFATGDPATTCINDCGSTGVLHAGLAEHELGPLRDQRFIFPALRDRSTDVRLIAVACLAFVWSEEGHAQLRDAALGDPDPGIRQSALWAYGFSGGAAARELCDTVRADDPSRDVRDLANRTLVTDETLRWWHL